MMNTLSNTSSEVSETRLQVLIASPVATLLLGGGPFDISEQDKDEQERAVPFDNLTQEFSQAWQR